MSSSVSDDTVGVMVLNKKGEAEFVRVRSLPSGAIDEEHLKEIIMDRGNTSAIEPIVVPAGTTHVSVHDNAAPAPGKASTLLINLKQRKNKYDSGNP